MIEKQLHTAMSIRIQLNWTGSFFLSISVSLFLVVIEKHSRTELQLLKSSMLPLLSLHGWVISLRIPKVKLWKGSVFTGRIKSPLDFPSDTISAHRAVDTAYTTEFQTFAALASNNWNVKSYPMLRRPHLSLPFASCRFQARHTTISNLSQNSPQDDIVHRPLILILIPHCHVRQSHKFSMYKPAGMAAMRLQPLRWTSAPRSQDF